jgi:hypothetical protein
MATVLKQDTRIGSLTTPLPKDGESDPSRSFTLTGAKG